MAQFNIHEDLSGHAPVGGASDRHFGVVFTLVFLLTGLWPLTAKGPLRLWALGISAVFLLVTLLRPRLLHALNMAWTRLGVLLGRLTNPIITGLLFYLVFTPAGVMLRWAGKDLLGLRRDPTAGSYWIERRPPGPAPKSMTHQF